MPALFSVWSERVERELASAERAADVTARRAHLELALLHFRAELEGPEQGSARDVLTTALYLRLAFMAE